MLTFNPGWDQNAVSVKASLMCASYSANSGLKGCSWLARQTKTLMDLPASWQLILMGSPYGARLIWFVLSSALLVLLFGLTITAPAALHGV